MALARLSLALMLVLGSMPPRLFSAIAVMLMLARTQNSGFCFTTSPGCHDLVQLLSAFSMVLADPARSMISLFEPSHIGCKGSSRNLHMPSDSIVTLFIFADFYYSCMATEYLQALGEAEAELTYLNLVQAIDIVLTVDSDVFVFGALQVIRSINKSGAHADEIEVYMVDAFAAQSNTLFSTAGFLLLAIVNGGDYNTAGLLGCGHVVSTTLASGPLATSLFYGALHHSVEDLNAFLREWHHQLQDELASMWLWPAVPDMANLAKLCNCHFSWGQHILPQFISGVWDSYFICNLMKCAILNIADVNSPTIHYISRGVIKIMSPSAFPLYQVDIFMPSLASEAVTTVMDNGQTQVHGASTEYAMSVWVPEPIIQAVMNDKVLEYHMQHPNVAFPALNPYSLVLEDDFKVMALSIAGPSGSGAADVIDLTSEDSN
ncbi:hypothetical protein CPB84DRAFT_1853910 [Gymnopilus junonius]|uniref:XPG-I domain-containing protein n=1 Tax=Gymnopilus junonius TaxID=109634 RepID=A0A9P5NBF2_GYMJU|nr:hypothetical protein CPB84DRAFT_1853910 [Gymnopilus junonius]